MTQFAKEEELQQYLEGINPNYAEDASRIWGGGVRCVDELANAAAEDLVALGINKFRVSNIIQHAKAAVAPPAAVVAPTAGPSPELKQFAEELLKEMKDVVGPVRHLMHIVLLGDIKPTAPSSSRLEKEVRGEAIKFYYGSTDQPPTMLKCMVTGEEWPAADVRAAHVWRRGWNNALLEYLANLTVNDTRNVLLLRIQIEKKLDLFEITIIPQEDEDQYQVVVLRYDLLDQYIGSGGIRDKMKYKDIDRCHLHMEGVRAGCRPARRVLAAHAVLAIGWAEQQGWIGKGTVSVPEAGWSSPGFNKDLMRQFLASSNKLHNVQLEG